MSRRRKRKSVPNSSTIQISPEQLTRRLYLGHAGSLTAGTIASTASSQGISVESLLDGPDGELDTVLEAELFQQARDDAGRELFGAP